MVSDDLLATSVATLLRQAPDSWADSPIEEGDALAVLTAAGFVERRVTFTVRLPGEEQTQRIAIEMTGEFGFAEAMEAVVQDWWARWGQRWQELRQGIGAPVKPIVTRESDAWRLSEQGRLAKADLEQGESRPIDFALKRGFFDGRPRRLPDGQITRQEPVRGYGRVVGIENAPGGPLAVAVSNWPDGAKAFAEAFAKALESIAASQKIIAAATQGGAVAERPANPTADLFRDSNRGLSGQGGADEAEKPADPTPALPLQNEERPAVLALLHVFTNGIVDKRIQQAARILADDTLTTNEKLTWIDELIHFPPTASAEQLGAMLGVTKQAVMKTAWWCKNRRGETQEEIDRRFGKHEERRGTPIDRRRVNRKGASSEDDNDKR